MLSAASAAVAALGLAALAPVRAYPNGAPGARLPSLGWSSWIALGPGAEAPVFDFCDEFSVMASADAFMELGLYEAGYRSFHLDDCWAATTRNATGYAYAELDHFPNGIKKVIDYVHSKGLVFGLYTCGGTETCVGGRVGSKDHWTQDAAVYAEWGVDWVKMVRASLLAAQADLSRTAHHLSQFVQDWCNSQGMDIKTSYGAMSKALNASGRHIAFSMCEWGDENPWEWGYDVAQSWRMAGDHTGNWDSTKSVIRASAAIPRNYTGQPWGFNDMDMLETGCGAQCAHANGREPNMTATEWKTEFSMWALSASPLQFTSPLMNCSAPPQPSCAVSLVTQISVAPCLLGTSFGCGRDNSSMWTDLGCRGVFNCNGVSTVCNISGGGRNSCQCGSGGNVTCKAWLSDLQREILLNKEILATNQDVTPQGTPVKTGDISVWARMLSDGSAAVALYNENDAAQALAIAFVDLGWPAGTTAVARDLWAYADLGTFTDRYPSSGGRSVAPHETVMLRLTKT